MGMVWTFHTFEEFDVFSSFYPVLVKKKAFYLMMVLTVIKSFLDPGSCPVSI
jgi:hypothetical protein